MYNRLKHTLMYNSSTHRDLDPLLIRMPIDLGSSARGLALAARRVADAAPSMPHPSLSRRLAGKRMSRPVPSVSLSRRDLRFFNAFPRLRINRYEGVIRATNLRDRAHELFRR